MTKVLNYQSISTIPMQKILAVRLQSKMLCGQDDVEKIKQEEYTESYTVQNGDTLWDLAGEEGWRDLYCVNRDVMLEPGNYNHLHAEITDAEGDVIQKATVLKVLPSPVE